MEGLAEASARKEREALATDLHSLLEFIVSSSVPLCWMVVMIRLLQLGARRSPFQTKEDTLQP